MKPVYVALLHYPIENKKGELIATAVTNLDLHDIARSCRTYGVANYFVVTPGVEQHVIVNRIMGHWGLNASALHHPDRVEALGRLKLVSNFDEAVQAISLQHEGATPEVYMPDARKLGLPVKPYATVRAEWAAPGTDSRPALIVFGTGWGIHRSFFEKVDVVLPPIYGRHDSSGPEYNHLSVRAAAAVILDRLLGYTPD